MASWFEPVSAIWGMIGSLLGSTIGGASTMYATRWSMKKAEEAQKKQRRHTLKGLRYGLGMAVSEHNLTAAAGKLRQFLLDHPNLLDEHIEIQQFYGAWLVDINELSPSPNYWSAG